MPQCDYVHEAWGPHEGCKEFMDEPETWPCPNQATVQHTFQTEGPDWPDYRYVKVVSTVFACDEHPFAEDEDSYWPYTDLGKLPINGDEF